MHVFIHAMCVWIATVVYVHVRYAKALRCVLVRGHKTVCVYECIW